MEFCDWPLEWSDCEGCATMSDADEARWGRVAGEMLWNKTGRVFGVCETTVRPCVTDCRGAALWRDTFWGRGPFPSGYQAGGWMPILIDGRWTNLMCGCLGGCSCTVEGPTSLSLPGPVQEIMSVRIDGEPLTSDQYRLMYNRLLIRTDGGRWPSCQNLLAPATEADTFQVVYKRGIPVPIGGRIAAALLASEMYKAACDDDSCRLPERLQTVTRQGITVGVFADADSWHETGIWTIDNWVESVTKPRRPMVGARSVDVPVRRGW